MDRAHRDQGMNVAEIDPRMPVLGATIAGKYRLDAIIGRGGMSIVYRAQHLELDRPVAIKILSASALLFPEYVKRLQREAQTVSCIRSAHVARVFDIGQLSSIPYLVMEHLEGSDLSALLVQRGPFPVALATDCIMHACEALAEAHALGIIHRDLKPANLFLTESVDGSPCLKVLDFGISRMMKRPALSPLTDPGIVLGTPSYMAPEQMEGSQNVDERSDIWALGAILYELLVGKPPYTGETLPKIFIKIMQGKTPRPSARRKDIPPEIDKVIARCLAVEPKDRYQSVAELAWALAAISPERTRDSAARIARVLGRTAAEGESAPKADSGSIRPVTSDERTTIRRAPPSPFARLGMGAAAAVALGVVLGLSVNALRPHNAATIAAAPPAIVETDAAAVAIAPAIRPLAEAEEAPAPPSAPVIEVIPPPRPVSQRVAFVDSGLPPPAIEAETTIAAAKTEDAESVTETDPTE